MQRICRTHFHLRLPNLGYYEHPIRDAFYEVASEFDPNCVTVNSATKEGAEALARRILLKALKNPWETPFQADADQVRAQEELREFVSTSLEMECRLIGEPELAVYLLEGGVFEVCCNQAAEVRYVAELEAVETVEVGGKTYSRTERQTVYSSWYPARPVESIVEVEQVDVWMAA